MKDMLIMLAVLAGWIIVNRYLLPRLGVPT